MLATYLRQRDDEIGRERVVGELEQPGKKEIERPQAAVLVCLAERLDADANAERQNMREECRGHLFSGGAREMILFLAGAAAEALFEIDAIVLDRFAVQFVEDAGVDALGERVFVADDVGQRLRIRRVLLERAERNSAKLLRGVGLEQMRAAVERVDRLALRRVAVKTLLYFEVLLAQRPRNEANPRVGIVVSSMTGSIAGRRSADRSKTLARKVYFGGALAASAAAFSSARAPPRMPLIA